MNAKPKTSQLSAWVDRGVALFCLGTLIPAALAAVGQIPDLAPWWMVIVGGGIVAASIGMMIASFLGWQLRSFALSYVTVVTFGLITWPAAWQGDVATSSPWLWMCLGVAAICLAVTTGTGWGFAYAIASGLLFAAVRMTPSGQNASLLGAFQDMINLVMNASVVIVALGVVSNAFKDLDEAEAATRKEATDAAIEEALLEERHRLDGIVHDEVMTTLVAAAHAPGDLHVAAQAQRAVDRLAQAEAPTEARLPVTGDQLTWLVTDVVSALVPQAKFVSQVAELVVPQQVASTLGMVVREVALNVAKHSGADEVEITLSSPAKGAITISVADNGVGFDPDLVPKRRLGLQVSVVYRMWAIGGKAEIHSSPGHGTVVNLTWVPDEASGMSEADLPKRRRAGRVLADIPDLSRPLLVRLVWVLVGLQFLLGWTSFDQVTMIWPVFVAQALAGLATWLTLANTNENPMKARNAIMVVVLLIGVTLVVQAVLPNGHWPGYATWHSSVVMVLLVTVLVRGQERVAWTGVGLFAVISATWAITHDMGVGDTLRVGFTPFSWMLVAQLLQSWLIDMADRMNASRRSSAAANKAIAQSFSKLVLRDVWLTQLRAQVGPLLTRIADHDHELSDEERAACLAQESRLRDAMRAGNLVTELTSDAIEVARGRGVDVRLVDSRGTRLPEDVRAALTRHLGRLLTDSSTKRVVARAAPEGYEDVVTVLAVRDDGSSELIGLDASGRVSTR